MRKLRYAQALTLFAGLAAIGFGIWAWPQRVEVASAERYGEQLRSMLALQVELAAEVMKARSGLAANYDGLVRIEQRLKALDRSARTPPGFLLREGRTQLQTAVDQLERGRRDTEELIERFKSENAVLRNSIRFLPVAAAEIDALPGDGTEARSFKQAASELVRDVLLLHNWNDAAIVARATRRLGELSASTSTGVTRDGSDLGLVLLHARVVCRKAPIVDDLLHAILARPAPSETQALLSRYAGFSGLAAARADANTEVLFVLSLLFVLSGAASVILHMRRTAAQLRDTTGELERAVASLQVEQEKQRELAELKNRFVSMTSHEFRTPLSAIMSSSEMLDAYDEKWPREKKQQHFERIRVAVGGMVRLLDGILLIGRSDAGKLEFNPAPTDLERFCADAVESAAQSCHRDHEIVLEDRAREPTVIADQALLRHIVDNLLSNALKYSPRGSTVKMEVDREGQDVVLTVRDRGIGIAERDQRRLFESFHRGGNVGSVSGSGLGLAIVKRAIDLHGGSLELQSELGAGTAFTVRIPSPRSEA